MKIYYRISNNSNNKLKLGKATKEACLANSIKHFQQYVDEFYILADNVTEEGLWNYLLEISQKYPNIILEKSSLGNAGSFWFLYEKAMRLPDNTQVYFLEDDYVHREKSFEVLLQGLQRAHYVTLYDHSDMYKNHSEGGDNPFIKEGGEITRVILTADSHFKLTISTTLTFATTTKILKEDLEVWRSHTGGVHVSDFHAFVALRDIGRTLITPIPGYSTHACIGYLSPLIDWESEIK